MAVKNYTNMLMCCLVLMLATSHALPRYSENSLRKKNFDLSGASSETILAYASRPQPPMALTDNYNLIMPDYYDHHPAESMQLQNFANFYEAETSPGESDLGMDETQFLSSTPVRAPQPINADEERIRQQLHPVDIGREKKALQKLKKGSTKPKGGDYAEWDQFDYDLYSVNPGENKKYNNDF